MNADARQWTTIDFRAPQARNICVYLRSSAAPDYLTYLLVFASLR
jgi:hypothetical protein